jgi:hypothetical protein
MCMSLTHRMQILLDEDQYARLSRRAKAEGRSVGALIREAVDFMWTAGDSRKAEAAAAVLAAEPMAVGSPDDLARELDRARGGRFADL